MNEDGSSEKHYLTLKELQAELLSMLCNAGQWFVKRGIRYSLSDGTLLGAVRHQGFIPWDDDLDIYIPRSDYEYLLKQATAFENETGYELRSSRNGKFYKPFTKIINPRIRAQEDAIPAGDYKSYLWIDVFPIDGVPESEEQYSQLVEFTKSRNRRINLCLVSGSTKIKTFIKKIFHPLFVYAIRPIDLANVIDRKVRETPYETSERVACPAFGITFAGKSIPRKGFECMVELPFEGTMQPCMSCWDEYLTKSYGDYMALPPEEKRWHHPQKTWRVNPEEQGS